MRHSVLCHFAQKFKSFVNLERITIVEENEVSTLLIQLEVVWKMLSSKPAKILLSDLWVIFKPN